MQPAAAYPCPKDYLSLSFEMVAAAMEMPSAWAFAQKSLFVVPNHLTEQWASEFLRLYPSANILVATKKDFETQQPEEVLQPALPPGDYDAIIIGHSQFERIPISQERQQRHFAGARSTKLLQGIEETQAHSMAEQLHHQAAGAHPESSWKARLAKLNGCRAARMTSSPLSSWAWTGSMWTRAHHVQELVPLSTKMRNVAGLSTRRMRRKSSDMFAQMPLYGRAYRRQAASSLPRAPRSPTA